MLLVSQLKLPSRPIALEGVSQLYCRKSWFKTCDIGTFVSGVLAIMSPHQAIPVHVIAKLSKLLFRILSFSVMGILSSVVR